MHALLDLQGRLYREKAAGGGGEGGVGLVLGAGNQVAVVVLDILHKLVRGLMHRNARFKGLIQGLIQNKGGQNASFNTLMS